MKYIHRLPGLMLICMLPLVSSCSEPPQKDLVGEWHFDTVSSGRVLDVSGHDNHATVRTDAADSFQDGLLVLDGDDDNVLTVPLSPSLRQTDGGITLIARVYRTANHNVAIVAHAYPTLFFGFHGLQFKWQVKLDSGRQGVCYADPKYRAELHRWHHVAATYNGWVARLYVDGRQICSDWTFGSILMPEAPFTIGAYVDDDGQIIDELSGQMDSVRIYRRALSSNEIEALYRADAAL